MWFFSTISVFALSRRVMTAHGGGWGYGHDSMHLKGRFDFSFLSLPFIAFFFFFILFLLIVLWRFYALLWERLFLI